MKSGHLDPITFEFKGPDQYHLKGDLCHAMAYTYNKDVGDVYASISYEIDYQVYKIPGKGFETIITFHPATKTGQYQLFQFDFSDDIFPILTSVKLYYTHGSDYIYVKPIALQDSLKGSYSFIFKHQRFSTEWEFDLRKVQWQENYNEKEFNKRWTLVNDYHSTQLWLDHIDDFDSDPHKPWGNQLYNIRWLHIFDQIKSMEFYQKLVLANHEDPKSLDKKINIEYFTLERDIEVSKKERTGSPSNLDVIGESYFKVEHDLLLLAQKTNYLYSDLYFEFKPENAAHFCLEETHQILHESELDSAVYIFEHHIQKQSLSLITQLIEEKKANEALFQIKRFDQFHKYSQYLSKSPTFFQFKAKAVYDIYLSYIQVSRQALEHKQIDMAINYLDEASEIQKQYPSEIINNLQVEKQLRELVKKGMIRYQDLLDQEEYETAKRVKEGILGLMKKLGMNNIELPQNRS